MKDKNMDDLSTYKNLLLDGIDLDLQPEDKKMLDKFQNLEFLSMNGCGLGSLKNLPSLPLLYKLDLSNNALRGDKLISLGKLFPNMQILILSNNIIRDFNDAIRIQLQKAFPGSSMSKSNKLLKIDLRSNPVTEKPNYRDKMFELFSCLEQLDGYSRNG